MKTGRDEFVARREKNSKKKEKRFFFVPRFDAFKATPLISILFYLARISIFTPVLAPLPAFFTTSFRFIRVFRRPIFGFAENEVKAGNGGKGDKGIEEKENNRPSLTAAGTSMGWSLKPKRG